MKKDNNKISTKTKHRTNPFILDLKGKMYIQPRANAIIAKGKAIIDKATGEITDDGILIGRRKYVDKSQFAKIYASEIARLYELSKPAQKVFLYLTKVMDYENKSFFEWKKVYKSYKSAHTALIELIGNDIIAPSIIQNVYWLNPTIVCKGERFAKYTEYVVEHKAEDTAKGMLAKQAKENAPEIAKGLFDEHNENPYKPKGEK